MTIEIRRGDDLTPDAWNSVLDQASHSDAMHQWEALSVIATHSDSRLHRLVGYEDGDVVGVFPVFQRRYGPVTAVFFPPPGLRIPYLGPALREAGDRCRPARERRQRQFLDAALSWVETTLGPAYVHGRTTPGYPDVRPFTWNGYSVAPNYTYHVDITEPEDSVLGRFSRDARSNIRADYDLDYDIGERGIDAIDRIIGQARDRYERQDISYDVTTAFVRELYEQTPDGTVRPYTCRIDGEFVGGIVAFEYGGTIARWQGGVRPDSEYSLPINDLLDWALITGGRDRGCTTYDMVGADNPRINRYKSKFGPELVAYSSVERGSRLGTLASRVYQRFKVQ